MNMEEHLRERAEERVRLFFSAVERERARTNPGGGGHAKLPLINVPKLTIGPIVELNRTMTEPFGAGICWCV